MAIRNTIKAIKFVRQMTGLPLKEAKYIVDVIRQDDEQTYNFIYSQYDRSRPTDLPAILSGPKAKGESKYYDQFDFLETAFQGLIISCRGATERQRIVQEAVALSRAMAEAANHVLDSAINESVDDELGALERATS